MRPVIDQQEPGGVALGGAIDPAPEGAGGSWRPSRAAVLALVIGLLVTVALALTSLKVYEDNEQHLLTLRARELDLVLAAAAPSIQTPLASAAALADATGGSPQKFRAFIASYVGHGRQFTSASLWSLASERPVAGTLVGPAPALASSPVEARTLFADTWKSGVLNTFGLLGSPHPGLAFEFSSAASGRRFAVYAENELPVDRRSTLEKNSAFSDLNYALYLGRSHRTGDLLVTSEKRLPISGREASVVVPFGAGAFTLVVAPVGSLGGTFFADLPWIVAVVGALVTLAAALMTDRLARGRQHAVLLAGDLDRAAAENQRMYSEQRSISQTLQHALLPDTLPHIDGLQLDARYVTARSDVDVGGDWFDLIEVDDRSVLLVIGDVSGHGLQAATTMALARHATLAYAAQDHRPASVLRKLSAFVNSGADGYFATVLCVFIEVPAHRVSLASAGHLAPLLIAGGDGGFLHIDADPPIGVSWGEEYRETTVTVPPHCTLVAFTDGLVERRGEVLDVGLERLRERAVTQQVSVEKLLELLEHDVLTGETHDDDTAIVGVQWES